MNNAQMMGYFAGYDVKRTAGLAKAAGLADASRNDEATKGWRNMPGGAFKADKSIKEDPKERQEMRAASKAVAADVKSGKASPGTVAKEKPVKAAPKEGGEGQGLPLSGIGAMLDSVKDTKLGQAAINNPGTTAAVAGTAAAVPVVLAYMLQSKKKKKQSIIAPNEMTGEMVPA